MIIKRLTVKQLLDASEKIMKRLEMNNKEGLISDDEYLGGVTAIEQLKHELECDMITIK